MSLAGAVASVVGVIAAILAGAIGGWPSPSETQRAELAQLRGSLDRQLALAQDEKRRTARELDIVRTELQHAREELFRLRSAETSTGGEQRGLRDAIHRFDIATKSIASLDGRIAELDKRLQVMETAVVADPQKALATPLLRRDLDTLQQLTARDVEALRAENARVYDLMKWLVGLMALVSLSLIGTAAGSVFKREQPAPKSDRPPAA